MRAKYTRLEALGRKNTSLVHHLLPLSASENMASPSVGDP